MARGLRRRLTSYGDQDFSLFLRKAFIKAMGFSDDALDRPIVGITDTYSDFNPCHGNVPQLIDAAKRGVLLAGGLPMAFPTMSLHESFAAPTSMYLRNLMAMETEELIRAQPMDAVILVGGCDKTIPAQVMAAASGDVPAIVLPTGPMDTGSHRGERLGACTDCRRLWGAFRAGSIDEGEIAEIGDRLASSVGTCTVMGTASTMACLVEAMGLALPMAASAPATSAERVRIAEATGRTAVALAGAGGPTVAEHPDPGRDPQRPRRPPRRRRLDQRHRPPRRHRRPPRPPPRPRRARRHRPGRSRCSSTSSPPAPATCATSTRPAASRACSPRSPTPSTRAPPPSPGRRSAPASPRCRRAGRSRRSAAATTRSRPPARSPCSRATSRPRGAVIKHAAASPALLRHEGRAVVFNSPADLALRLDDEATGIAADDVLVLRNAGPRGAPGMPEAGYLPIPRHLARAGVRDMVRISDARMSGTAFGTVVLHVTPEAADGGPLAVVRTGDRIRLDVPARRLDLLIDAGRDGRPPRRPPRRPRLRRPAAMPGCSTGTSSRPTRGWTSTSSGAKADRARTSGGGPPWPGSPRRRAASTSSPSPPSATTGRSTSPASTAWSISTRRPAPPASPSSASSARRRS